MLLMLVLGCTLMASCMDSDDWDENVLTGKWWSVDDPADVVCIDFYRNHNGLCSEDDFYNGYTEDPFTWFVDDHMIHIIFSDGSSWIWDYDLYDGHTVMINGRLFSRDRSYYSKYYQSKTPPEAASDKTEKP